MRVSMATVTCIVAAAASALAPRPALAQSAADKAAARKLATDGIERFNERKFPEALEKLERAQALFDAPVHLLYIARCQVELGKLVEGAETYRQLARVRLPPGASQAFEDAVAAAGPELKAVEPRVPAVTVVVAPAKTEGVALRIDGAAVSAAAIGVERPINPGRHVVEASAPGHRSARAEVELRAGQKQRVELKLVPEARAGGPAPGQAGATGAAKGGAGGARPTAEESGPVGFMLGLRLGGSVPFGDIAKSSVSAQPGAGGTEALFMSDYFQPGGGGELRGGVRFMRYFTGVLSLQGYVLRPGRELEQPDTTLGTAEIDTTVSLAAWGLGVMVASDRDRLGGFGELLILPSHAFTITQDIARPTAGDCRFAATFRGTALQLGGGVRVPVSRALVVAPYAQLTIGTFTSVEEESTCTAGVTATTAIPKDEQSSHGVVSLGVGGEFEFGPDVP
ncbi:MAG: PEGA domain-containing protein [Polyangiaceae bacterium]|nr:PEGA domain-containing protein [Polyangiaceae bacterium]